MELNLLDIVKNQIGNSIASKAANLLGENAAATQKAMAVLLPSVLGGMANQATTLSGADNLLGMINKGGHDGSLLNSLGKVLENGGETEYLLKNGSKTINILFGDKVSDIAHWVASHAGIKSGSAWSLLNLAAPILMGAISKNMDNSRSASSLVSLLGSQLPFLKKAIPNELLGILGLSQLSLSTPMVATPQAKVAEKIAQPIKTTPKPVEKVAATVPQTSTDDKPLVKKLTPWLLLLGASLIGLFYLRSCKSQPVEIPAGTTVVEAPKTDASTTPSVSTAEKVLKLTDGELKVKTGSFLDLLYTKITDANADLSKSITFDNVNFAKYKTDLTDSSKIQLDDLVKIMKAYPSVQIKINGYTDSRGDASENKELSNGRAASVKAYLSSKGIASERMTSEGLGQANPIADNETEAGRAKNRRIEAVVTKK